MNTRYALVFRVTGLWQHGLSHGRQVTGSEADRLL